MFFVSFQLLEKDPALAKYHSVKSQVQAIKRFGDILVILVAAGTVSNAFIIREILNLPKRLQLCLLGVLHMEQGNNTWFQI